MILYHKIKKKINKKFWDYFDYLYYFYVIYRSIIIRKKGKIKVLFVLSELGAWKTEMLYVAMKSHPRFEPIIGVTNNPIVENTEKELIEYLESKKYDYVDLNNDGSDIDSIKPDISFYYKPYDVWFPRKHIYKKHLHSLPCFISYGFITLWKKDRISFQICNYSWFVFVENELVAQCQRKVTNKWRARNVINTGVPMQDSLGLSRHHYNNPWHYNDGRKKIIYAPHHSIKGTNGIGVEYSTFLDFGEFMLELAQKYKDKAVFAFKPHPTLYSKLIPIWGKEKTDLYYSAWGNMENTQFENGEYTGLFAHSDAMIHDCGSFQIEYLFTKNPVLFLDTASYKPNDQNEFGKMANEMHYRAKSKEDIETFLINVLSGIDPMKDLRNAFYKDYLLPPNGRTACENIISTILGE